MGTIIIIQLCILIMSAVRIRETLTDILDEIRDKRPHSAEASGGGSL